MLGLYTDINVDGALIRALRSHGVDVITAQEDGGQGKPDVAILNRASELGRLLVTADQDWVVY
jgi:predicted nuclease of predicted toxin-antitoxin system